MRKIDVLTGTARFTGPGALTVGDEPVAATDIVLATGSAPRLLPGLQVGPRVITSDEALQLDRIPSSVVVIGAGAVGLEFASMYRSFGAEVTLLEALPRLAPLEDEDLSKQVARAYRRRGITAAAGASVTSIVEDQDARRGGLTKPAGRRPPRAPTSAWSRSVAARSPKVSDLDAAGVALDPKGFVEVDDRLRTSAEHVWAVGDVAATPLQLAHVAFTEGIAVAERIAGIDVPPIDYTAIPRVTYCTPEIASVGHHRGAGARGGARHRRRASGPPRDRQGEHRGGGRPGQGRCRGERRSRARASTWSGPHVTDLIAEGMLITAWEASPTDVAAHIHPHPSLSEGIGEAMLALAGKSLHTAWRRTHGHDPGIRRRRRAVGRCPTSGCATCCDLLKLARYVDERLEALYRQGRLPGALYSGRGQEGTHVGVAYALERRDSLFPTHRDLTAQLAKGLDLNRVLAQFWGRIDGYLRGRDGNSHIGDWQGNRTYAVMSHLPIAYPVAVGAGWAYQRAGDGRVALAICGDGATSNGRWHEAINMVGGLPPAGGLRREQQPVRVLDAERARVPGADDRRARVAYGIPGVRVDGSEVLEVLRGRARCRRARPRRRRTDAASNRCRCGGAATRATTPRSTCRRELLEHYMLSKDPVKNFEQQLRGRGRRGRRRRRGDRRRRVEPAFEAAHEYALASPFPEPGDV